MPDEVTGLDWATLVVAIIGAVTGIAALVAQVWQAILSGPRVRVRCSAALAAPGAQPEPQWFIAIDVSNVGRLPVTVVDVGVELEKVVKGRRGGLFFSRPSGETLSAPIAAQPPRSWMGPTPPHRLIDGDSQSWLILPAPIAQEGSRKGASRHVRVYARLATGKTIVSRRTIDIQVLATS